MANQPKPKWRINQDLTYTGQENTAIWENDAENMYWLPFNNQKELNEALRCLYRWRDFIVYTFWNPNHHIMSRRYEYFPIKERIIIKGPLTSLEKDRSTVAVRFTIAMRYIDEKPS